MNEIHNWAEEIVLKSLLQELELEVSSRLLFRTDSLATKLWSGFAKLEGKKYLECFLPLIKRVIKECAKGNTAFDNTKKEKEKEKERERFVELLDQFFRVAVDNYYKVDLSLKNILRAVSLSISQKFPEHPTGGLSSLFFLRFLCSAISQPETYELIPPAVCQQLLTPVTRKTLVSASRALQNLANRIEFAQTDTLSFVNPYLKENFEEMNLFFKRMATWREVEGEVGNNQTQPLSPSLPPFSTIHLTSTPGLSPPLSPHSSSSSSQSHVAFTLPQAETSNPLSSSKDQEAYTTGEAIVDIPVEEALAEEDRSLRNHNFSFVSYQMPDVSFSWPFSLSSLLLPLYAEDTDAQVTSPFNPSTPTSAPSTPFYLLSPSTTPLALSPLNSLPTSGSPSPLASPHPRPSTKSDLDGKDIKE
eukprot:TRINITY_DN865_c0_g1_i1.p1 TRINITY_DN865_c0_g1~~TRINITY_DN865_c0_g1_i1.p1  ORF type:complete len:430 (+),score=110.07 TRINITY_DN865_c0_g1_i1:40-1290(+)